VQTILITGVSDGIGHALAVQYAALGARVLGVGRRSFPQSLAASVAPADYCVTDLEHADAAAAVASFLTMRQVTRLDVLVLNAAVGYYGAPAHQSGNSIDELLQVNLYTPIALTHALLPFLRDARGLVAFVSSVHSALPTPDFAVYTATKAGLDGFARSLRLEEQGAVDVIVLWPGPTRTQMHVKSGVQLDQTHADRYASPEQVAHKMIAAIRRRRSHTISLGNRLLRWTAVHFESQIDAVMVRMVQHNRKVQPRKAEKTMSRHAVVTGAAEGIGRALVEVLGANQLAVTGIDVNVTRAAQTQHELMSCGLPVTFIHADLGEARDLARLTAELIAGPPIDMLVNNAGINCVGAFARSDLTRQQMVLDVNLRAPLHLTAALLHAGKIAHGGTLVFVSSLSRYVSYPGAAVYAASKEALASYARSLTVALAPQGIHVLVVYPGPTRTEHARRYSLDNRREERRMAPEALAASIYRAMENRKCRLIPGMGNRFTALLGQWAPAPVEWVMKKTLFAKL